MDIKQKFSALKEKAKSIQWKKLVQTKAFITVGCVMLVCVAVLVSTLVNPAQTPAATDGENKTLGNTLLVDASVADENANLDADTEGDSLVDAGETDDFFVMAIINRTQVRDDALEVLREIAESPDTLPDAKEEALSSIAAIADEMSAEANIETLIQAKGISQCVAVISGDACSVIVNKIGLAADELTQITDIVYEQTGIPVKNITVVEAKQ